MDTATLIWIAITNGATNAITGLIIGIFMYWYGRKQGEKSKELLKTEIQIYIKNDLFPDLKEVITGQVKGIFGPFAKSVNGEVPEVAREWANNNPGIFAALINLGKGAAINKAAKVMGLPKEVKEYAKMAAMGVAVGPNYPMIHPTQQQQQQFPTGPPLPLEG